MRVFLAHSLEDAAEASRVTDYLQGNGIQLALRGRDDGEMSRDVLSTILAADACVALVGKRQGRELFEVGVASGAGVPTLVVALPGATVPDALSSNLYVAFRGDEAWDMHNLGLRLLELERSPRPERSIEGIDEEAVRAVERDLALADALDERDFARLVAMLLERRGFSIEGTEVSAGTRPDLICRVRGVGRVVIEVKKRGRSGLVPVEAARQVLGYKRAIGAEKAIVVSDGGFTSSALSFASEVGVRLMGLDELVAASTSREVLEGLGDVSYGAAGQSRAIRTRGVPPTLAGRMGVFEGDSVALARLALRLQWELASASPEADLGPAEVHMLLELFVRTREEEAVSLSELSVSTGLRATSALRMVSRLEAEGWIERRPDHRDGRRQLVSLTQERAAQVDRVLSALSRH